jgi:hypothetical protein
MLFVRGLNLHQQTYPVDVIFKVEAGWINGLKDPAQQIDPWNIEEMDEDEMPKPDFTTTSGSIHRIVNRTGTAVQLDTFLLEDKPPFDPATFNNETAGAYIVHMMAGHKSGFYVNISAGSPDGKAHEVYYPLICPGPAWVHMKDDYCDNRVEFLPSLPRVVRTNSTLTIREEPSVYSEGLGYVYAGQTARIVKYYPSPTGVWGEVEGGGWIAIQYLPYKGFSDSFYYTDWYLTSLPALRPRHTF